MAEDFSTTTAILATNAAVFDRTVQGVSGEKWVAQPSPDSNHMLWIAGHVVVHRAKALRLLGQPWSAPWESLFARGVAKSASEQYPKPEEVLQEWKHVCEGLRAGLANVSAELLNKPSSNAGRAFEATVAGTISFLSFHESYHVGQMGYLRKWLGYGQVVG